MSKTYITRMIQFKYVYQSNTIFYLGRKNIFFSFHFIHPFAPKPWQAIGKHRIEEIQTEKSHSAIIALNLCFK